MSYTIPQQHPQSHPLAEGTTAFIRQTYRLFLFAILGMVGAGIASYHTLPREAFLPVMAVDAVLWIAMGWFGWRRPTTVTLPLLTVVTGLMLGILAHRYTGVFLHASLLTVAVFTGLSLYVHTTKQDFSFIGAGLNMAFWVMLGLVVLMFFIHLPLLHVLYSALGVAVFSGWILYDTSQIVHRAREDYGFTPGVAALELLLDIIGLLRWLLELLDQIRR